MIVSESDLTDGQMSPTYSPNNGEVQLINAGLISRYIQQSFTDPNPEDRHSPTVSRKTSLAAKVTPVKPHIFVSDNPAIGQESTHSSSTFQPTSEEGFPSESTMWITDNLPSEISSLGDESAAQNEDPSIASANYTAIGTTHQTQPNDSEAAMNDDLHLITNPPNTDYTSYVVIPHGTGKLELLKGARPLGRYVQTNVGATQEGQGSRYVGVSLGKSNPSSLIRRSPATASAEDETHTRNSLSSVESQLLDNDQHNLLDHDTLFMSHHNQRLERSLTSSNSSIADKDDFSGNVSDSTTHYSAASGNPSTTGFVGTPDKAHRSRRGIHPLSVSTSRQTEYDTQARGSRHPSVNPAGNILGQTEHWVLLKGGRITKRLPVSNDARSTEQETAVRRSSYTTESQLSVNSIVNAAKDRDVR
ncbi:hypothetical protein scyTo_0011121 [Scyliorhinus torazame]|uniref:Uncharacterized protein n=1 Tax=Scyliorhinus torazame TaxID=75743 RepID=A0A401NHL3_SCYTO|nr:hypothetical protein [Scyliorhinus torazame]